MHRLALLLALILGLAVPASGQAPSPVPALPDTPRITTYALSNSTCACSVGFALYGDNTDVDEWIQVFVGSTAYVSTDPVYGWSLSSVSGTLATLPRPITNAVLTFTNAQTATITIVGARRPRRLTQFPENRGVAARDLNQTVTDQIAAMREAWDLDKRAIVGQPGEVFVPLPPPAARAGGLLGFDSSGKPLILAPPTGAGNVLGPGSSVNGDTACWNGTSGLLLSDCGRSTLYATAFPGATAGDQIVACVAALPTTGGTCDARGLPAGGTINAITIPQSNYRLLWPCGYQIVTGTIQFYDPSGVQGLFVNGCSASFAFAGTQFLWAGNSTDPMFRFRGVRDSEFDVFAIKAVVTNPLATAIQLETATGTTSSRRIFRNILIDGTVNYVKKGFRWCIGDDCGGAGGDLNNDTDYLDNTEVYNYDVCAYSIEGSQSKSHTMVAANFNGFGVGQRGVCTTQAANSARNSGSFRYYGGVGGAGGNTVADFDLGAQDDNILISGCNIESSSRLLLTGATSVPWSIMIEGCRWAANAIHADNKAVIYRGHGGLTFIGNHIELVLGVPAANPTVSIEPGGPSTVAAGFAAGNDIMWNTAADSNQPFISTGGQYWTTSANVMWDNSTTNVFNIPDQSTGVPSGTPTIASGACGTTTNGAVVAGSTNRSGRITIGSASTTTCTISWSGTFAAAAVPKACSFFPSNAAAAATGTTVAFVGAPSSTQVVLTGSALANTNYSYVCQ